MKNFSVQHQPITVITGATSGIGKALAIKLSKLGYQLILVARNEEKTKRVMHEIVNQTGNIDLSYYIVDLSNLPEVYQIGSKIHQENPHIDILVNNAGMFTDKHVLTKEGYELTFTTNYLGPVLFTHMLIPSLCQSENGHILNISSSAHRMGEVHWEDFNIEKNWYGFKAYSQSKLLLNMYSFELARRLRNTSVRVNAVHPGVVKTNLGSKSDPNRSNKLESIMSRLVTMLGISSERSADGLVGLLTSSKHLSKTGKYFKLDKTRPSSLKSRNKNQQLRLWDISYQILSETLKKSQRLEVIERCT